MASGQRSLMDRINDIDVEDLQYVERDLNYYELASLGLLLYGREPTQTQFILQKLVVLAQNPPRGQGAQASSDILQKYSTVNPLTWRVCLVEALAIIKAKKVLRKLGFPWQELHDHYLPHIPELSLHIHPMLKVLYIICDRLTADQASELVLDVQRGNAESNKSNFCFRDHNCLEVFLLYWMTQRLLSVGNQSLVGVDVQLLISYFKIKEMDSLKALLVETIKHNTDCERPSSYSNAGEQIDQNGNKDSGVIMDSVSMSSTTSEQSNASRSLTEDANGKYRIRPEQAGIILIINQREFHEDEDKSLNPKAGLKDRPGTNVDRDQLQKLFGSFGYRAVVYNNLTHIDMLHRINDAVKRSNCKDSLIVCILSHGTEGIVYGCNSVAVSIESIKSRMSAESLKGKPKMLIIQACQNRTKDKAVLESGLDNIKDLVEHADMLTALSSVPGTAAVRDVENGSRFIQSLCRLTQQYCKEKHMADILTMVNNEITEKYNANSEYKMLSNFISTLRKSFYLPHQEATS